MKRAEIKITGRVQGVFFRQVAKSKAGELGLAGFVRNEPDGSVLIVAEGEEEKLQKLVEWAKVGTELSQVERVDITWKDASNKFKFFEMI